jgi:ATP-dependent DNA helicase DinG
MILLDDAEFVAVDIETDGFLPREGDRIIAVAVVRFDVNGIGESFQSLVCPERSISPNIERLVGIGNVELESAPTFEEVWRQLVGFMGNPVLVAHNAPFDIGFLEAELARFGQSLELPCLDTLSILEKHFELPSLKLDEAAKALDLEPIEEHTPTTDAKKTGRLFLRILTHLRQNARIETVDDLLDLQ